jgi:hypothetical protein
VTSDATLDLSQSTVSGFVVASTNATGTNFTVRDFGTAFQIAGGAGLDTITAQGFALTADQRNAIFATASVERIVDTSGTYTELINHPPVVTASDQTVAANVSLAASSLFSVSDADGDAIISYHFWDSTADAASGHFEINGVAQGTNQAITVTSALCHRPRSRQAHCGRSEGAGFRWHVLGRLAGLSPDPAVFADSECVHADGWRGHRCW